MRPNVGRRLALFLPLCSAVLGVALLAGGRVAGSSEQQSGEVLVAGSICEAQQLKHRKQVDPSLEIEIPPKYDTPWPTRAACRSYVAAEDPNTPGPVQPIPFSHKHHAGDFEIECLYCHTGTDRSSAAGVPSVEVCMGCHAQFPAGYDEFEGIRVLKQDWEEQRPTEWERVYWLPDYVRFRHNRHIAAGIECQACHGEVAEMEKISKIKDTKWWPWLLPTHTLEMGWCIKCHRQNGVSQDCYTCHY
jgi:hypothetical protein